MILVLIIGIILLIIIYVISTQLKQEITTPLILTSDLINSEISNYIFKQPQIITSPLPITTSSLPITTSLLPITTSSLQITSPPQITTSSPPITTSLVSITTSPPPITTSLPPITTSPPPITTSLARIINLPYLYEFKTHIFTNAKATGSIGPTLEQIRNEYKSEWASKYINMINNDGIQLWTVPISGYYFINAVGAGGGGSLDYGKGKSVQLVIGFNKGEIINILVGQKGLTNQDGGGGTFILDNDKILIIVAGGGGSKGNSAEDVNSNASITISGNNGGGDLLSGDQIYGLGGYNGDGGSNSFYGGGGGGYITNGKDGLCNCGAKGGLSFSNSSSKSLSGGFGGGGKSAGGGGGAGGGGYSGGGGGGYDNTLVWTGGGGGSCYGITPLTDNGAINENNGMVIITFLSTTSPEIKEDIFIIQQRQIQLKLEEQQRQDNILRKKNISNQNEMNRVLELERIDALRKQIFLVRNSSDIKDGKYRKVPNSTFRLTNDLTKWLMIIRIYSQQYWAYDWQGIIGNAYNPEITPATTNTTIGWGLWINTQGYLYWHSSKVSYLYDLGVLEAANLYEIRINCTENILKFDLIKIINNIREIKTQSIEKGTIITDKGYVTIGGEWISRPEQKLYGDIRWVEMLVTDVELSKYS